MLIVPVVIPSASREETTGATSMLPLRHAPVLCTRPPQLPPIEPRAFSTASFCRCSRLVEDDLENDCAGRRWLNCAGEQCSTAARGTRVCSMAATVASFTGHALRCAVATPLSSKATEMLAEG